MPKHDTRDPHGRFAEGALPPSRKVLVCLPEPFIERLDAYGREHGCGRGQSIQQLLEGVLAPTPPPELLAAANKDAVTLAFVKKEHPTYKHFRDQHYIPDQGVVGQSLQYLIFYDGKPVGIIGGTSSVHTNGARDEYFGLSDDVGLKNAQRNSIINNNVFRLDYPAPNLATIILSKWRKRISADWEFMYGVPVAGFETFVVEQRLWNGKTRNGACYRADNWNLVGISKGYGESNVRGRPTASKILREKKLVYCKRINGVKLCREYQTAWNNKDIQSELDSRRNELLKRDIEIVLGTI